MTVPAATLELLKASPAKWARVMSWPGKYGAAQLSVKINGAKKTLGPGWQARAAQLPEGGSAMWLRWVGDD